jgi:hypothetical protein
LTAAPLGRPDLIKQPCEDEGLIAPLVVPTGLSGMSGYHLDFL